jgi:hypothetical protein
MRAAVALGLVLAALASATRADEPPSTETSAVRLIRLVGRPGDPGGPRVAAASLTLEVGTRTIPFQAERVDVLRGNLLGADVLAEISPYRPSLRLNGVPDVLRKVETSTAQDEVEISGWQRPGSRWFLVSDVKVRRAGGG